MPLIGRKVLLLAKAETSYGVDSTPTGAANAIETENLAITPLAGPVVERNIDRPFLGSSAQIQVGQFVEVTFDVAFAGAGTSAITPPKYAPLLKACGFITETIGIVDVQYILGSVFTASGTSVSMYFHHDGQLHKVLGARGDIVRINLNPGEIPRYSFRFQGLYSTATSTADATPTYTGFQVPKGVNDTNTTSFTLHGAERNMIGFEFALGNDIQYRNVVGAETVEIVDRKPTARVIIESPAISVKDWFTAALNATTGALQAIHGTAAFNIVQLDAPVVQVSEPKYGRAQGVSTIEMRLSFIPSAAGNDEFKISTK